MATLKMMDAFEKAAIFVAAFEDGHQNGRNPEGDQDGQHRTKVATFGENCGFDGGAKE